MVAYLLTMAKSPALWRSIVYVAMAAGITLDESQQNAIIACGLALVGAICAFVAHNDSK